MDILSAIISLKEIDDSGILREQLEDAVCFAITALEYMESQGIDVKEEK